MRKISLQESKFLELVAAATGFDLSIYGYSPEMSVEPFSDGGMGSLKFDCAKSDGNTYESAISIIEGEFDDVDGTRVEFWVDLDELGNLFELDLWRVDFEPLQHLPSEHDAIRIRIPES